MPAVISNSTINTRMHSSRMRTVRSLIVSHRIPHKPPLPRMPPFHHTHPPSPCMLPFAPYPLCHACPLCYECPPFATHAPLPCTPPFAMHAPPLPRMPPSPHMPPFTMHTPWQPRMTPRQPYTPPRGQTDTCKNITFAHFVYRGPTTMPVSTIRFCGELKLIYIEQ